MGNYTSAQISEETISTPFVFGVDEVEVQPEFKSSEASKEVEQKEEPIKTEKEDKKKEEDIYVIKYNNEVMYYIELDDLDAVVVDICKHLRDLHTDEISDGIFDIVISNKQDTIVIQMFKKGFNIINAIDTLLHTVTVTRTKSYYM